MGKFIRDNQLDQYAKYDEEPINSNNKKKKIRRFKDPEEQKNKPIKKN